MSRINSSSEATRWKANRSVLSILFMLHVLARWVSLGRRTCKADSKNTPNVIAFAAGALWVCAENKLLAFQWVEAAQLHPVRGSFCLLLVPTPSFHHHLKKGGLFLILAKAKHKGKSAREQERFNNKTSFLMVCIIA